MYVDPVHRFTSCKHCVTLISNTSGYIEMENKSTSWAWMKTTTLSYSNSQVWET